MDGEMEKPEGMDNALELSHLKDRLEEMASVPDDDVEKMDVLAKIKALEGDIDAAA
jgi:hypothetical protein